MTHFKNKKTHAEDQMNIKIPIESQVNVTVFGLWDKSMIQMELCF